MSMRLPTTHEETPAQSMQQAEVTAALADALALNLRAEREASQLQGQLLQRDQRLNEVAAQAAQEKEQMAQRGR